MFATAMLSIPNTPSISFPVDSYFHVTIILWIHTFMGSCLMWEF